ncbi:MAG TPA: glucuronate isomerase [Candidatus Ornithoclostridium faecavium]|nr:glucuronate isomerase [Candidatus Ornithoclostridium faecavium]
MVEYRDNVIKLLGSKRAEEIYAAVKDLPIIDYHCHLSPKEIFEDRPFDDIGGIWLAGDHYKWRLMRGYGVDEKYITGDASWEEKFEKFAEAVGYALGNPVKDWVAAELMFFFGITTPLNKDTAKEIREKANAVIKEKKISPRKLIEMANVEYIATTDDPCDSLEWHKKIREEGSLKATVVPTFRVDNLVNVTDTKYLDYIAKLSKASGMKIRNLDEFEKAVQNRLDFFVSNGCKFSDIGVPGFPSSVADYVDAKTIFSRLLDGVLLKEDEADSFKGYLYVFLAGEYEKRGIVMQMHLAVTRNSNELMTGLCGRDSGFDCVGDVIDTTRMTFLFNKMNKCGHMPETIIYTLNPSMYYTLITMIGAFRNVHLGVSWWFCDHKRGMRETFDRLSELGHICSMVGMLTDSRSFLSYTRHDYYRQCLCDFLADNSSERDGDAPTEVAKKLCYYNAKKLTEE